MRLMPCQRYTARVDQGTKCGSTSAPSKLDMVKPVAAVHVACTAVEIAVAAFDVDIVMAGTDVEPGAFELLLGHELGVAVGTFAR